MEQSACESNAVSRFIEAQKLKQKPFPLMQLLRLYTKARSDLVYCNYFEGFKLLVNWLKPIDISGYAIKKVFTPLYNYEQQEMAVILGVHPSIIQQVFIELYGHQTTESFLFR